MTTRAPRSHECRAQRCRILISATRLMCRQHWRLVPPALRRKLVVAYKDGARDRTHPTATYAKLVREAVQAVAEADAAAPQTEETEDDEHD